MKRIASSILLPLAAMPAAAYALPYSGNLVYLQQAAIAPLIIIAGLIVSLAIFITKSKGARAIFQAKDTQSVPEPQQRRSEPAKKRAKAKPKKIKARKLG